MATPIVIAHHVSSLDDPALLADFRSALTTNVIGPVITTNAFLPLLKKGTLKKVITLSSGLGSIDLTLKAGLSNQVAYSSSKTALEMVIVKFGCECLLRLLEFMESAE